MKLKYNEEKNKDLDQGWAWVIMIAASLAGLLNGLLIYAAGVIHVALLEKYEQDNAYTSLIGSLFTSLLSLVGPFASMLINVFSCRMTMIVGGITLFVGFSTSFFAVNNLNVILVTYGIIAGTGLGFSATPPLVVIGYFFHLRRGLALAVVVSGAGVGMFIAGPLVQALLNLYGLQGTFLVLAAISANHLVLGALMRPSDLEYKHKKDIKMKQHMTMVSSKRNNNIGYTLKNLLHFDILLNKAFMFCNLQYFMWNIPYAFLLLHLTNYAVVHGSTKEDAALLIAYVGIGSTFGRIVTGLSSGHNGLDPVLLNFGFNGLVGFLTMFFPFYSNTKQGQIAYSCIFGIYSGGLATMINPLCMELIGVGKISSGIGTMYFIGGIGYLMGPPLSGLIIDQGGTYEDGFQISGGLFLLAALLTLIGSNWRASTEDSDNMRCSSKDLNGIISQCSLNVPTERGQNVLLQDRNMTIEVTLDQQSRLIEENDNSAEAFNTSHEQESVNEFTPLTYKENGALHSEMDVVNKLSGSLETVNNSERNRCHVLTED